MGALIYDNTITSTTDVVTISLTSPIVKGELYELSITPVYNSASNLKIFYNGNNNSNYTLQYLIRSGTSNSAGRESVAPPYVAGGAYGSGQSNTYIKLTNTGYVVSQSDMVNLITDPSSLQQFYSYGTTTYTVSSITSIGIVANNPNGIAAGTRIQLRKVGEKVSEVEVSSSTNTVSFTGLNIKKEDEYLLVSNPVYSGSGQSVLYLTANNNDTLTNYYRQVLEVGGNSITGNRQNNPYFQQIPATPGSNKQSLAVVPLKLTNTGNFIYQSQNFYNYTDPAATYIQKVYGSSTYQTTSITSLKIMVQDSTNSIGAGSRFELYKLYEEPVVEPDPDTYELLAEHTVYSPTTQIDIPVNITKDDEVRLVYTFVGDDPTAFNTIGLYPNDLTTNSNYWRQSLEGNGTFIGGLRSNINLLSFARSGNIVSGFADIKISNNNRFVMQSQQVYTVGSQASAVQNLNYNTVGTQTVSSITKLSIITDRTNGIQPGSKIQLFKVN